MQGARARSSRGSVHWNDLGQGQWAHFSRPSPVLEGAPRHQGHPGRGLLLGRAPSPHCGPLHLVGHPSSVSAQHPARHLQ
eukprot:5566454-Pyramimonas_sp.AAC.1